MLLFCLAHTSELGKLICIRRLVVSSEEIGRFWFCLSTYYHFTRAVFAVKPRAGEVAWQKVFNSNQGCPTVSGFEGQQATNVGWSTAVSEQEVHLCDVHYVSHRIGIS